MKKLLLVLTMLAVPLTASAKVTVVGTLPVFTSIAKEVGGDRVEAKSLARPNQDPHFLDAKPTFVVALSQADLLIHGGLELEIGWLPPILVQARNPKINSNTPGNVDLSQGLPILEIPQGQVDRSAGDVHPSGNPHFWLDPQNARIMAVNIARHLKEIDPQGKHQYEQNLNTFLKTLNEKITQWGQETAKLRGKRIMSYHKGLSYLADWTGLEVVGTIESRPGIPPSSKHVDDLLMKIPHLQIKAIFMESFYPRKVPEYIARKANIPLVEIPVDVGEEGTKNYFDLMDHLMTKMKGAL